MSAQVEEKSEAELLLDQHKLLLGGVTIAWNDCTQLVFELFLDFSEAPLEKATIVFFGIRNDRTQRQMVRDLARVALAERQALLKDITMALGELDQTAQIRNEAMHSAWAIQLAWTENEQGLPTGWEPPKLVKVKPAGDEDDGFTERFKKLEADLQRIGSKLIDILRAPRMPSVGADRPSR